MSTTQLAAGKTKTVTSGSQPNQVILTFRDDITAGDGKKHEILPGKAKVNASITAKLYEILTKQGIPNHFIRQTDPVSLLVKKL